MNKINNNKDKNNFVGDKDTPEFNQVLASAIIEKNNECKKRKRVSKYERLNYFKRISMDEESCSMLQCQNCNVQVPFKNSDWKSSTTSYAVTHLESTICGKKLGFNNSNQNLIKTHNDPIICDAINEFITSTFQPMSLFQSEAFEQLVMVLNPKVELSSGSSHYMVLKSQNSKMVEKFREYFSNNSSKVSIAIDCVSPKSTHKFLGISGHFWDSNFKSHSMMLALEPLHSNSTGFNLANLIKDILIKYGLENDQIQSVTSDDCSNNHTTMECLSKLDLVNSSTHINCNVHIFNLAVQKIIEYLPLEDSDIYIKLPSNDSIKTINGKDADWKQKYFQKYEQVFKLRYSGDNNLISKMNQFVNMVNGSKVSLEAFQDIQKKHTKQEFWSSKLKPHNSIKWRSLPKLISSFMNNKTAIVQFIVLKTKESSIKKYLRFSEFDWTLLENLSKILLPFSELVNEESVELNNQCSISKTFANFNYLFSHLEEMAIKLPIMFYSLFMANMKLIKYYDRTESDIYYISTLLDPMTKKLFQNDYFSKEYEKKAVGLLEKALAAICPSNTLPSASPSKAFQRINHHNPHSTSEISKYLAEPASDVNANQYWKSKSGDYPSLALLARSYLSSPSSQVFLERKFKSLYDIFTSSRGSLLMETISTLYLHKEFKEASTKLNL
ncbi:hypothetical protein DLAC_10483 [Tieghemostelium lacteum]|uniref:HAT C-terminal dimerisation domain-containing protein n=1 Tax=Tieghemostelium lacteum TaxID=361077 RepID=A0A151Z4K6_TIELA|nr:hypothetical protein DLAC_10483 [Tieghemostelium lacteum]|eukprot:KYQ88899.1 hypothetical protein DLAC_10483 [Tieghemostelium lacteum]